MTRKIAARAPVTIGYASNAEKAQRLATQVRESGGSAEVAQVDMRHSASVQRFIGDAASRWGGLDGIASVTGPWVPLGPITEATEEDFKRIYEIDVFGSFNILKHGSLAMKATGGGAIVLTLTTAMLRTLDLDGLSGGPKAAVAALLKQVAREMGPHNIRCNGIAPGVIDAGLVRELLDKLTGPAKHVFDTCVGNTPLGRMGQAEEIAAVFDFLLSPGASYVNGQIIGVDGGHSA